MPFAVATVDDARYVHVWSMHPYSVLSSRAQIELPANIMDGFLKPGMVYCCGVYVCGDVSAVWCLD